jgi:hypothetical protein
MSIAATAMGSMRRGDKFCERAALAASLAQTLSVHAGPREEPHTAKGTAELQYRLVELPDLTPDGAQGSTVALSINDRGEVLGSATRGATLSRSTYSVR